MAEHPESYSGWYGFESRWVHVVTTFWWLTYAAIFFALARWRPRARTVYVIQGCLSLCVAISDALFGPKGSAAFMVLWGLFIAYLFIDVGRIERRRQREQGDQRRRLRSEHEAELLASFQEHVSRWTCPHCGQKDFRVQPPVTDPVIVCAECRYKVPDLPSA